MNNNFLNFEGITVYNVTPTFMVTIRTYSYCIPSMCPEFDPNPEECYAVHEIDTINLETKKLQSISSADAETREIHKELKELYDKVSKHSFKGRMNFRKEMWSIIRGVTPYTELSAKLQIRHDMQLGRYPNITSKYFKKLTLEELQSEMNDMIAGLGENMNDWRMYNDRIPERYVDSIQSNIRRFKKAIETKKSETFINN